MKSALYEGSVAHTRTTEVDHAFDVPLFMVYLDLGELEDLFESFPGWTVDRPGLAWFRRADHFGDPSVPLERSVRDRVEDTSGRRPEGPVRVLTHLRYFGYCFNPISVYFCFDRTDDEVVAMLAEVHNTPWGERHVYVLPSEQGTMRNDRMVFRFDKDFHVSPFLPMDTYYELSASKPGETLSLIVNSYREDRRILTAELQLTRNAFTRANAYGAMLRFPFMTVQVTARIYYEALKLWWKGATFHSHPRSVEP